MTTRTNSNTDYFEKMNQLICTSLESISTDAFQVKNLINVNEADIPALLEAYLRDYLKALFINNASITFDSRKDVSLSYLKYVLPSLFVDYYDDLIQYIINAIDEKRFFNEDGNINKDVINNYKLTPNGFALRSKYYYNDAYFNTILEAAFHSILRDSGRQYSFTINDIAFDFPKELFSKTENLKNNKIKASSYHLDQDLRRIIKIRSLAVDKSNWHNTNLLRKFMDKYNSYFNSFARVIYVSSPKPNSIVITFSLKNDTTSKLFKLQQSVDFVSFKPLTYDYISKKVTDAKTNLIPEVQVHLVSPDNIELWTDLIDINANIANLKKEIEDLNQRLKEAEVKKSNISGNIASIISDKIELGALALTSENELKQLYCELTSIKLGSFHWAHFNEQATMLEQYGLKKYRLLEYLKRSNNLLCQDVYNDIMKNVFGECK